MYFESNYVEKLREQNKQLIEIIKKCLFAMNSCQCLNDHILFERKQINAMMKNLKNILITEDLESIVMKSDQTLDNCINNCCIDLIDGQNSLNFEAIDQKFDNKLLKPFADTEDNKEVFISDNRYEKEEDFHYNRSSDESSGHKTRAQRLRVNSSDSLGEKQKFLSGSRGRKKKLMDQLNDQSVGVDSNANFRCDWIGCGKVFKNQSNLNGHRVIHLETKKYKCQWSGCEEAFIRKEQLTVHISYNHTNERRFKCLWPGCEFNTCYAHQLRTHKMLHTGEKPFKCDWPGCEYKTCYPKEIKKHKMRHTGEKPYKCCWPSCDWSFRQKAHLKTHMLKHTGEKPVVCEFTGCDRRFQTRQVMRFHLEKLHKIQI